MNVAIVAAMAVTFAVVAEIAFPGHAAYHAGWYNVALAGLVAVAVAASRRQWATLRTRPRVGLAALIAGAGVAALAGVASGLLAPDNQTLVGAPGQRLQVESLGILAFPFASNGSAAGTPITLERRFGRALALGARPRDAGNFILWTVPRTVVYAEARDARGQSLTVTQPTGSVFLSPVLLMQHRQTIAGMDLPFDSFNVPAAGRVVKAVLFTAAQAAMLLHGGAELGEPAVLFAVDDEKERPIPHAIALSAAGRAARAGGLTLRGVVGEYPAVEAVAAPNLIACAFGTFLAVAGLIALCYERFRELLPRHDRSNVSQHDAALG